MEHALKSERMMVIESSKIVSDETEQVKVKNI